MLESPPPVKEPPFSGNCPRACEALEASLQAALETYSNVHRGSGHNSMISTHLYEQARDIVLEHLKLDHDTYVVIFCTARGAELLRARLKPHRYHAVSSQDIGLPLGIRALAVQRPALPRGAPIQAGGGTARLVFRRRVIWAAAPDRFEAGTPAILNVIAFARALQLIRHFGPDAFRNAATAKLTAPDILYHDELESYTGRELLAELQQTLIGQRVPVPTLEGARPYVNLDNAASTPTFAPIWKAVCQTWRQPEPVQREVIREVRSICAGVLGAPLTRYDVIFTANTTAAINLVAASLRNEPRQGVKPVIVNTILEHNSNELPWRTVPGASLVRLPVDAEGLIDLHELETLLCAYNRKSQYGKKRIQLVAVSGASNVLGVYNDLAGIAQIVHRYGARLLVDAAQLVAHRQVDMEACGIDYLAFSGHKVYAPFGSGVLLARQGLLHFSAAERALIQSSGEENAAGIAALGKALMLLGRIGLPVIQKEEQALTARALRGLAHIPGLEVYGVKDPDSPGFALKGGVIVFRLENMMATRVAKELAERGGIGVRAGCHCAHLLIKRLLNIHPLQALLQGLVIRLFPQVKLPGLTRVSLGLQNDAGDVDTLIHTLGKIARTDTPLARQQTQVQKQMDDFTKTVAQRVYARL